MVLVFLFLIYQCILLVAFPVIAVLLIYLAIKGKIGSYKERFGFVPVSKHNEVIWFHAVSVGEVLSLQQLIIDLKKNNPSICCYVTVGTISGKAIAQKQLSADYISFMPYDFLLCMLCAFNRIRPKAIIIVEAELWPTFLTLAWLKMIPMYLLNARINVHSCAWKWPVRWIFKTLTRPIQAFFAQSINDKNLFVQAGIDSKKVYVLGNVKAYNVLAKKKDIENSLARYDHAHGWALAKSKILLVGSVHPGELEIYLDIYLEAREHNKDLKFILAPRHFEWQQELVAKLEKHGLLSFVWTDKTPLHVLPNEEFSCTLDRLFLSNDVLVVCKLGELFLLYPHATLFFLGGTFVPVGGHNLLEPAVWGVPTIIGPYYHNCKDIADRLDVVEGVIKVNSLDQAYEQTMRVLSEKAYHDHISTQSYAWLEAEAKHVERVLENLWLLLR